MKSLKYRVFGPKNLEQATKKIVEAEPKRVRVRLERKINGNSIKGLNGNNFRVNLNVKYIVVGKGGETSDFELKIPNAYDFGDSYGGDNKNVKKVYSSLKEQIDYLRDKGIKVTSPFSEDDFKIILKDNVKKK